MQHEFITLENARMRHVVVKWDIFFPSFLDMSDMEKEKQGSKYSFPFCLKVRISFHDTILLTVSLLLPGLLS